MEYCAALNSTKALLHTFINNKLIHLFYNENSVQRHAIMKLNECFTTQSKFMPPPLPEQTCAATFIYSINFMGFDLMTPTLIRPLSLPHVHMSQI